MKSNALLAVALVAVLALGAAIPIVGNDDSGKADTVIYGTVYTGDTYAEAVAIRDGVFVYVGDAEGVSSFIGSKTKVIDSDGSFVMPGMIDSHAHPYKYFEGTVCGVNMMNCFTLEGYLGMLSAYIEENPDKEFYWGYGWSEVLFTGGARPTADILDEVCSDKPVCLEGASCHSMWCNTKFLKMTGVTKDTPDPVGGVITRDADGNPDGVFKETAVDLYVRNLLPVFTVDEYCEVILAAQEHYIESGYTSYFETILNWNGHLNLYYAYEKLDRQGLLKIRVDGGIVVGNNDSTFETVRKAAVLMNQSEGGNFQITTVKIFIDGVIEGHTALLLDPYKDRPDYYGECLWEGDEDKLSDTVVLANSLGLKAHFHVIGDGAMEMMLDVVSSASEAGYNDIRNTVTHMQLFSSEQAHRMSELGMVSAPNLLWGVKAPGMYDEIEVPYLGEERASNEYPYGYLRDSGVVMAFATDWPAGFTLNPYESFATAVTRMENGIEETELGPQHALTRQQAMAAFTINGAYSMDDENARGSIEVGKQADLIIIDRNIMECELFDINFASTLLTMIGGEIEYDNLQSSS